MRRVESHRRPLYLKLQILLPIFPAVLPCDPRRLVSSPLVVLAVAPLVAVLRLRLVVIEQVPERVVRLERVQV